MGFRSKRLAPCSAAIAASGATHRLTTTLLGQALLQAALFARLQVEAILLDVLADTFALDLAAEATKGLFKWLIFTNGNQDQGISRDLGWARGPKNMR